MLLLIKRKILKNTKFFIKD